jgi:hypothetical protein
MPRVNTQKAAKDYPDHGIAKGDTYYSWKFRHGPEVKSKTYPRPSQLTQSKLSTAYAAMETLEEVIGDATDPGTLVDALNQAAEEVREVAQEYRDNRENMPESLQDGPTGQEMEEKADSLEASADELEEAATEIDNMSAADYIDEDELLDAAREELGEDADDDAVKAKAEELRGDINAFEDLGTLAKGAFMDAARETAGAISLEV